MLSDAVLHADQGDLCPNDHGDHLCHSLDFDRIRDAHANQQRRVSRSIGGVADVTAVRWARRFGRGR